MQFLLKKKLRGFVKSLKDIPQLNKLKERFQLPESDENEDDDEAPKTAQEYFEVLTGPESQTVSQKRIAEVLVQYGKFINIEGSKVLIRFPKIFIKLVKQIVENHLNHIEIVVISTKDFQKREQSFNIDDEYTEAKTITDIIIPIFLKNDTALPLEDYKISIDPIKKRACFHVYKEEEDEQVDHLCETLLDNAYKIYNKRFSLNVYFQNPAEFETKWENIVNSYKDLYLRVENDEYDQEQKENSIYGNYTRYTITIF